MRITDRIQHAWNAFTNNDLGYRVSDRGSSSSRSGHRSISYFNVEEYVTSIFNRIAVDVSTTVFKHVKINPDNEDQEDMNSGLNECLTVEANIDQSHIQLIHDLVYSMFDEGVVALVPTDTTLNPELSGSYDILSLRVGKIVNWFPKDVEIMLYNEETGQNERIFMKKKNVAIIENPLYAVVNDSNSTLKRLIRKLNQMDNVDDMAESGRLDIVVNVPYPIKTEAQRVMAEKRIKDIQGQLASGRNGIAYMDATEKMTQLNRPVHSQLPETIARLDQKLYNEIGLTKSIFDGTAREGELRNYYSRSIDPIIESIVSEMRRKFLTKTARTQGQTIIYYRDMFKMVPIETLASLGDTFIRNRIATSNELRKMIGLKPSNDPKADELFNPNIADKNQEIDHPDGRTDVIKPKTDNQVELERLQRKVEKMSNQEDENKPYADREY